MPGGGARGEEIKAGTGEKRNISGSVQLENNFSGTVLNIATHTHQHPLQREVRQLL